MDGSERPAWFVGDLGDPWVAAIADRLPDSVRRRGHDGELPEAWVEEGPTPGLVVLHRPILTGLDVHRVVRLRARSESPTRVILCVGPHARYDDLARSARLFDAVLPEATASETIRRHVAPEAPSSARRPPVRVVSGLHDVRSVLVDACRRLGHRADAEADADEAATRGLVLWEVPMLDPTWPERMARRGRSASVVALLGFADRASVSIARDAGAAACLDWPCDLDDLGYVLDRVAASRRFAAAEPGHPLPPTPASLRRAGRSEVVGPGRGG